MRGKVLPYLPRKVIGESIVTVVTLLWMMWILVVTGVCIMINEPD